MGTISNYKNISSTIAEMDLNLFVDPFELLLIFFRTFPGSKYHTAHREAGLFQAQSSQNSRLHVDFL